MQFQRNLVQRQDTKMSIFDDKNLLSELLKIAQVPAQPTVAPGPKANPNLGAQEIKDLAAKLVANLQEQLSVPKFTSEKPNADLRMQAKDLNSMLAFLRLKGIAYNDLKIVYPNDATHEKRTEKTIDSNFELSSKDPKIQELYAPYPDENPIYFIYKDGLIAYLRDLKSKNIPLLTLQADRLIDQANNELGLKMSKEIAKEEIKIGPDVVIDELPSPLTLENATESGTAVISGKDLASFSTPSTFIGNILGKLKYTKDDKVVDLRTIDKGTICEVVNILMTRAKNHKDARPDDPRFDAYLKAVTQIASTYSCPAGQSAPSAGGNVKPVGYILPSGGFTAAGLAQLGGLEWPLDPDVIDFGRITRFTKKYVDFTGSSGVAAPVSASIGKISQNYSNIPQQDLSRTTFGTLEIFVHSRTGRDSAFDYINTLTELVQGTYLLIQNMNSRLRNSGNNPLVKKILEDISEQAYYYSKNMSKLTEWTQDFNKQLAQKHQQK